MGPKLLSWQTGLSFVIGAGISLFVSFVKSKPKSKPEERTPRKDEVSHAADDGDLQKALMALNESVMAEFQRELQNTVPWVDLSLLFGRWNRLYPSNRRRLMQARSLQSQDCRGSGSPKSLHSEDLLSVSQGQPEILRPLAPEVAALLQQYSEHGFKTSDYDISSGLSGALNNGKVLWSHFARAVVQLDDRIAVKLGPNISLTDADMTAHIRKHSADISVPKPLGVLALGGITYAFMSLIEGRPLDKLWPNLSEAEKWSVRDQLDVILGKLRLLPLPSQYLGGGTLPQCIDCRMWKRKSPEWMQSEAQFNEFLLSGNGRSGMEPYVDFVRPMLGENHRIVLTHGDLHPRNILAISDEESGAGVRVTGLLDWEVGGAYPEYWEFVKSLNTVRPIRSGDWPFFLPVKGMGKYFGEYPQVGLQSEGLA